MTPEFLNPPSGFDAAAFLDVNAAAIGLEIAPPYRDGVLMYLDFTARMANYVMEFELPEDTEPASVFRPGAFDS